MIETNGSFQDLSLLMNPRSIVLVGGSDMPNSIGARTLENLTVHSEWRGTLSIVNPARKTVAGRACVASVADLDHIPDVACVAVRAEQVPDALQACARHGIKFAVVFASGFGETGEAGREAERQMKALAARTGMRIYGPNCPGLNNMNAGLGLTFSPAFRFDRRTGPIGLATQGGGLGRAFIQGMDRGLGVGLWCSSGNEADLEISDFIHYMAGASDLKVIATVIEGVRDGAKFCDAALAAARMGKPVIAVRVGKSDLGMQAAQSHTAAISGASEINAAVFRELGIIEADDVDEMLDVASLLARGQPHGKEKIAVYGFSGGSGALAADHIGTQGLELSRFTETTHQALRRVLPDFAAMANPVDVTGAVLANADLCHASLKATADDDDTDIVLVPIPFEYGEVTRLLGQSQVQTQSDGNALIVPVWMSDRQGDGYKILADAGLAPIRSIRHAITAIRRYRDHGAWRRRLPTDWKPLRNGPGADAVQAYAQTEPAAKRLLRSCGIETPAGRTATSPADARAAFLELGGKPVAMKIVSDRIAHKTNVGGVRLNIATADEAAQTYTRILEAVRASGQDDQADRVLVESMLDGGFVETVVGVTLDPVFGHIVTFGLGGISVELFKDVSRRMLPLTRESAAAMIDETRCAALLHGFRGQPGYDVESLIQTLLRISELVCRDRDTIAELEINPLAVTRSRGAVALDVLLSTRQAQVPAS